MAETALSARLEIVLRELSEIVDQLGSPQVRDPIAGRIAALVAEMRSLRRDPGPEEGEGAVGALPRREAFSERLILSSVDGILAFDCQCRYTVWNPAMERMSGVPAAQAIGEVAFDVFPFLREVGEDKHFHETLAGQSVVARDRPYVVPETNRRGFFEAYYSPLRDESGEIIGGLAVIRDITERREAEHALRESEQRFRKVFEDSCLGIVLADHELRIFSANPRFCGLLGFREEELTGRRVLDLTHPDDRAASARCAEQTLRGEASFFQLEERYLRKDGGWLEASLTASSICDEQGRPLYLLAMVEDITERRRAERQARQHEMQLAHVLRLSTMGEMATGIAHELNQPLSAIVAFADACRRRLAEQPIEPDKLRDLLAQIVEQGERAGEIIRRLRSFIRKREPKRSSVDLNQVVEETVNLIRSDFVHAGVALETDLAEQLPCVQADAIQIQQVILNLLRNALDAVEGFARARHCVIVGTVRLNEGMMEVFVRDTGRGVSKESAERLFEPFYTSKPQGLGMGLAISRSMIESHGGKLWSENHAAGGATFRFQLPVTV